MTITDSLIEAPIEERWVPIAAVCETLSLDDEWLVARWIQAGELDAINLDGSYRVSTISLARFIHDRRVHTQSETPRLVDRGASVTFSGGEEVAREA
jgi:hypothetical protein